MKKLFLYGIVCMFSITYQMGLAQNNKINNIAMEDSSEYKVHAYHTIKKISIAEDELAHFICIDIPDFNWLVWQGPQSGTYSLVIYDNDYFVTRITVYGCSVFTVDAFNKFKNEVTIELRYNGSPVSGAKIEGVKINEIIQPLNNNEVYDGKIIEIDSNWLKARGWYDGIVEKRMEYKK
ncbi:MAG TPA: hypothetical protein VFD77_05070 [Brumimicrobium sp.]|nr:hypothetical protein [Brumimicrobium sp.]